MFLLRFLATCPLQRPDPRLAGWPVSARVACLTFPWWCLLKFRVSLCHLTATKKKYVGKKIKNGAPVWLHTYYKTERTHTNHIALAAVSALNGFIFPFIGKVKKSLSHLFIRLGDSFSSYTSQPQHLSGCPSRGAAEGKLSHSVHHVWAVLCPGATFVTRTHCEAFPWALMGGKKGAAGGCGTSNPVLGTDWFPYMGTDDEWKCIVQDAFVFLGVHKELPRAWDKLLC